MSSKSDYLENAILDHLLGGPVYTRPDTVYAALFTAAPGDANTGTEVTGTGYARVAIANVSANWNAASGGTKTNATRIVWPAAGGSWGTVVAFGLYDALSGGNLLYHGRPNVSRVVASSDQVIMEPGALVITED